MSEKIEVCRRKEIILSQRNVGKYSRMEKSRREGHIVKRKGKHLMREGKQPGAVGENVSSSQSCVAMETHRSRPTGHLVPVSHPRVSQT